MNIQLYCNVDGTGAIVESLLGARVIPDRQFDYFFYLTNADIETVTLNIPRYRVVNRELVLTEG